MNNQERVPQEIILTQVLKTKAGDKRADGSERNQDYWALVFETHVAPKKASEWDTGMGYMLSEDGKGFGRKLTAIQTVNLKLLKSYMEKGLTEGVDFNNIAEVEHEILTQEFNQAEFEALPKKVREDGFQEKRFINDAGKEVMLTSGGLPIYRRTVIAVVGSTREKLVDHDELEVASAPAKSAIAGKTEVVD